MDRKEGWLLPGTRYRLVRMIGAGSCSEVFEAMGSRGELRAIKVLRPLHAGSGEVAARLLLEGRALSAMRHAHIIPVERFGLTADGRPFLVMPLLCGETLRARLQARLGGGQTELALDWSGAWAEAFEYAAPECAGLLEACRQAGTDLYRYTREGDRIVLPATVGGRLGAPRLSIDAAAALNRGLRNEVERRLKGLLDRLGRPD